MTTHSPSLPKTQRHAGSRTVSKRLSRQLENERICGVSLGRGEMSIESRDIEIWTRLLFDLGGSWLEVFNALDENGYALHLTKPEGEFRPCA